METVIMDGDTIIRKPNVYVTPDLPEGDESVIHIIKDKQTFVSLKFEEGTSEMPFKPFLSADKTLDLKSKPKIKKQIDSLEDRIVDMGVVYTSYSYLLTVKDNEVFLLSTSLSGMSLGYDITKEIAEKIGINILKPVWSGHYTNHIISAFIEDIFVQKQ